MKKLSLILLSVIFIFTMSCNNEEAPEGNGENETATNESVIFNTSDEMVEAAKEQIEEVPVAKLKEMIDAEETFLLLDVRMSDEFNKGYILGSVNIPRGVLEFRINKESFWEDEMLYLPKKEDLIIILCKKGHRGSLATVTLQSMGFTNVKNLEGGFTAFKEAYPDGVEVPEGDIPAEGGEEDDGGC